MCALQEEAQQTSITQEDQIFWTCGTRVVLWCGAVVCEMVVSWGLCNMHISQLQQRVVVSNLPRERWNPVGTRDVM